MKRIHLTTVTFEAFGAVQTLDYKVMLQTIMEAPADPQKGAGIAEIRKSIRVLDALDAAADVLMLEDADYEYLVKRVQDTKFTSSNRAFVDFVEHIERAANES